MLQLINKQIFYNHSLCQQCGICRAVCPTGAISTKQRYDGLHDILINYNSCIQCQNCVRVCPSNHKEDYSGYFAQLPDKKFFFAYNADNKIRHASSSGGTCKTLIVEALRSKLIDGVFSLRKSEIFPYAEGEFYTHDNLPAYEEIPNSIYHSVMLCSNVSKVSKCNRLMIIGTACQLRALEKALKGKYQQLIKVCIFCKQQKTLNSTRFLSKIMGAGPIDISGPMNFHYRGSGWPGIVSLNAAKLSWNRAAQLPFGRRLWTVPGCNICGDPFGLNCKADIALMDPWKIKEPNDLGETLVTVYTQEGLMLLNETPRLILEEKAYKEIEPALGLKDIWRKQQLVPYFSCKKCNSKIKIAGRLEQIQRYILQKISETLPCLPIIYYRIICKLPDLRNLILR